MDGPELRQCGNSRASEEMTMTAACADAIGRPEPVKHYRLQTIRHPEGQRLQNYPETDRQRAGSKAIPSQLNEKRRPGQPGDPLPNLFLGKVAVP